MLHALRLAATALLLGCSNACLDAECVSALWTGEHEGGELGNRFSAPLEMSGDGIADLAAGERFSKIGSLDRAGTAYAWSGASGARLLEWPGASARGYFGHAVLSAPDLDGDGLADVIVSAPGAALLAARSPASGQVLWTRAEGGSVGWHLALADDHDADGVIDFFCGVPGGGAPHVELRSGRTGAILRRYDGPSDTFGQYVARLDDLDGDGLGDLFVGASLHGEGEIDVGAAFVIASRSGELLRTFIGEEPGGRFGESVTGIDDIDGDAVDDLAVGAPHTNAPGEAGQVFIFSSASGELLHRIVGLEPGEIYGRNVARVHDIDGDGTDDIAIGAPWWSDRSRIPRAGRFEIVSGRTAEVLVSVHGEREGAWLGWHIVSAERMIDGTRRGLLVSSILSEENGISGAGRIELYELSL